MDDIPFAAKDVFTFEKTSSFGVIQFWNVDDNRCFKRWLMKNEMKYGKKMLSVSENLDKEQSRKERSCGNIKKTLREAGPKPEDVLVKYRQGVVKLHKVLVAEWKDGQLVLHGRAKEIEGSVHMLLDEKGLRTASA